LIERFSRIKENALLDAKQNATTTIAANPVSVICTTLLTSVVVLLHREAVIAG
jgi:hypothetical protein